MVFVQTRTDTHAQNKHARTHTTTGTQSFKAFATEGQSHNACKMMNFFFTTHTLADHVMVLLHSVLLIENQKHL